MTKHADVRFFAALRDFLGSEGRSGIVTRTFDVPGSVKDMIEACGVPHTEVAAILANGEAVDFGYRVGDGDRISVYPPFCELDVDPAWRVGPEPLPEARFVLDGHLGRLARYLRLLGFDTAYDTEWTDPDLVAISTGEERVLVTRDVGLLMHGVLTHGYFVRAIHPEAQLAEVTRRYDLGAAVKPFTRCMACNGLLSVVDEEEIAGRLAPRTRQHYRDFQMCFGCDRIYWKGSHYRRLRQIVDRVSPMG